MRVAPPAGAVAAGSIRCPPVPSRPQCRLPADPCES